MFMLRFLWAMCVVLVGCQSAAAIVGSSDTGESFASEILMVLYSNTHGAGFCSGVVIAPNVILTAAHCVSKQPTDVRLHYREHGAPILLDVSFTAIHPAYKAKTPTSRERSIDLALVRLKSALPDQFKPARLELNELAQDSNYRVAGYGLTDEGDSKSAGSLRDVELVLRKPLSKILLWLEGHNTGACVGDSGGPIYTSTHRVIAITAWTEGFDGKHCGKLTQGIRVAPHYGWIEQTLKDWGIEAPVH